MVTSSMKRRFSTLKILAAGAALATGLVAAPKPAAAQEIQLTGPLAGAPSVRKLRLYREGRVDLALGGGFTLLDEYKRTIFISGRLQYNIWDWLSIGAFGGFAPEALSLNTDLADRIDSTPAPRNTRTAVNLPGTPGAPEFGDQAGKLGWMVTPQVTFIPFRGKLALFQKLFVDTDLYLSLGPSFVGVKERANCGNPGEAACTSPQSFTQVDRVAIAPVSGALGLTLYPSNFISLNVEYRAFPFSYNRGGFDSRGTGPDASFPDNRINEEDRTFKFNQLIFVAVGFHLPTTPKQSE